MSLWKRRSPEKLYEEAGAALEAREFERALKLGEKLQRLRHTSGFEIRARALAALDREPEALRLMEESVTIAPSVAPLWTWLGEYRSNAGDYPGAHAAFARAAEIDPALQPECQLNQAIVFLREEQPERAWETLECIATPADPRLRGELASWRADTLLRLGRHERAIELCTREIDWITSIGNADPAAAEVLASPCEELQVAKATALWRGRRDAATALELCYSAIEHVKSRGPGFDLIREIGGLDASRAKPFQLLCNGKVLTRFFDEGVDPTSVPKKPHAFLATYRVLADSPEEALDFLQRLEAREWDQDFLSLELEKATETRDEVTGCKGIYFRGGRTFYSGKDEQS